MADWGPLPHPMTDGKTVAREEGAVTQPKADNRTAGPRHDVNYDATDSRHNREAGLAPWDSVDVNSGPTSDTDFDSLAGRFEDGPGAWRQT